MWNYVISQSQFASSRNVAEEEMSTGKWLVPVPLGDPDDIWETICVAAASGVLVGAKISSGRLDRILGHHLVCVYCPESSEATVRATLEQLRTMGVTGPLEYKTDKATYERREDRLWSSGSLEANVKVGGLSR